jgi:hypothetical protein
VKLSCAKRALQVKLSCAKRTPSYFFQLHPNSCLYDRRKLNAIMKRSALVKKNACMVASHANAVAGAKARCSVKRLKPSTQHGLIASRQIHRTYTFEIAWRRGARQAMAPIGHSWQCVHVLATLTGSIGASRPSRLPAMPVQPPMHASREGDVDAAPRAP